MLRALARKLREHEARAYADELERIEALLVANAPIMRRLLADVETEHGPAERVVVVRALDSRPKIYVYHRDDVLGELRARRCVLEADEIEHPALVGVVHVLIGTEHALRVRRLERLALKTS